MNREPASKRDLSIKEDSRIILQGIFILFYVNKCFACPYVCASCAVLVPEEIRMRGGGGDSLDLESQVVMSIPVGAGYQSWVLYKNKCSNP